MREFYGERCPAKHFCCWATYDVYEFFPSLVCSGGVTAGKIGVSAVEQLAELPVLQKQDWGNQPVQVVSNSLSQSEFSISMIIDLIDYLCHYHCTQSSVPVIYIPLHPQLSRALCSTFLPSVRRLAHCVCIATTGAVIEAKSSRDDPGFAALGHECSQIQRCHTRERIPLHGSTKAEPS